MGYAKHVGRVGALAVALGIGSAIAAVPAWADTSDPEPSSSAPSSSNESSSGSAPPGSATETSGVVDIAHHYQAGIFGPPRRYVRSGRVRQYTETFPPAETEEKVAKGDYLLRRSYHYDETWEKDRTRHGRDAPLARRRPHRPQPLRRRCR